MPNLSFRYLQFALLVIGFLLALPALAQRDPAERSFTVRVLAIGIDTYSRNRHLKGAAADATDIATTLQKGGVDDVTLVVNGDATRKRVTTELSKLVARTKAGDIIYVAFSGLGTHVVGKQTGTAYLLSNAGPNSQSESSDLLYESDLGSFASSIANVGGHAMLISDTSTGTSLTRMIDARSNSFSFRTAEVKGPKSPALADGQDCMDTKALGDAVVLCADARPMNVSEIDIPGVGYRGALSFAFARAIEGAADLDGDGSVSKEELVTYIQRLGYQLTNGRQHIVAIQRGNDGKLAALASRPRGISVRKSNPEPATDGDADDGDRLVIYSINPNSQSPAVNSRAQGGAAARVDPGVREDRSKSLNQPILLALTDNQDSRVSGLVAGTEYRVVSSKANPDITWDPASGDVVASGDVIANNIDRSDLPGVIDRMAAIRWLKARVAKGPQDVRILPGDHLHNKGSRVEIEVGALSDRSLVLFNIAGNGTIQLLYPLGSDPPILKESTYRVTLQVREPFGADQVVAISAPRRLTELENVLAQMDRRRTPAKLAEAIDRFLPPEALVGTTALYTTP